MMISFRKKKYYRLIIWAGFATCMIMAFWRGSVVVMNPDWLSADDYFGYWAAGNLSVQGNNPYTPDWLLTLQKEGGWAKNEAVILWSQQWTLPTWSPPWTLPLVMPLGMLSYPMSRTVWMLANIAFMFLSANTLWRLYGGSEQLRWVSWLLGFSFIPVLDAIKKGQTGILILLGIVGFLFFIDKKKPWLAGLSLALLMIKPHVAYLFLLAVLLWSVHRRAWPVIAGFALVLVGTTLISSAFNQQVVAQYLYAVRHYPPSDWVTPTIGGILRLLFGSEKFWLQFLPPALGLIWLVVYWVRHRATWDWLEQAPIIILVSLLTAAYGWSFDQPVALVAIIQISVLIISISWQRVSTFILITYIMINVLNIISPSNEIFLFWLAPAMLIWYLVSRRLIDNRLRLTDPARLS